MVAFLKHLATSCTKSCQCLNKLRGFSERDFELAETFTFNNTVA